MRQQATGDPRPMAPSEATAAARSPPCSPGRGRRSLAPEWQSELERAWAELDRLREEYAEVAAQLAVAHENLRSMARHVDPAVMTDGLAGDGDSTAAVRSVAQPVEAAGDVCRHLVILDEARDSARRAAYRQPARVYRALLAMDEVAAEWSGGKLPTGFRDASASSISGQDRRTAPPNTDSSRPTRPVRW